MSTLGWMLSVISLIAIFILITDRVSGTKKRVKWIYYCIPFVLMGAGMLYYSYTSPMETIETSYRTDNFSTYELQFSEIVEIHKYVTKPLRPYTGRYNSYRYEIKVIK